jgi:Second Messenger Oligonucleotide or Dinucleotide Synthetase domain
LWNHVIPHFNQFLRGIELSPEDRKDADSKAERIARSLFAKYYPSRLVFDPSCYLKVGSYGKDTACASDTDLDMLFIMPNDVYWRVEGLAGNRQSQLLQEVKNALFWTFPRTPIRADGPIIQAPFSSYHVEVLPAFQCDDGTFLTAHTANGGSWRSSNPAHEYRLLQTVDQPTMGKATHLTKMLKAWKHECNVEIKSISLEVLAVVFVDQWHNRHQTMYFYDWMMRDFFAFMLRYVNGWTRVPGTVEQIQLGDCWESKCRSAYGHALKACEFERLDYGYLAVEEWQKIFGCRFTAAKPIPVQTLAHLLLLARA